jgi:hypothetical protein
MRYSRGPQAGSNSYYDARIAINKLPFNNPRNHRKRPLFLAASSVFCCLIRFEPFALQLHRSWPPSVKRMNYCEQGLLKQDHLFCKADTFCGKCIEIYSACKTAGIEIKIITPAHHLPGNYVFYKPPG